MSLHQSTISQARPRAPDHRRDILCPVIAPEPQQEDEADGRSAAELSGSFGAVASHYERARSHGARIVTEPADLPFGERQYTAEDPAGHQWTFSQTLDDVHPEAWGGTLLEPD